MRRLVALTLGLLSAGCADLLVGPNAATDPPAMFEQVWRDVDRHYSFFQIKDVNWDSLHTVYGGRVGPAASPAYLASTLGSLLIALKDYHATLWTPFGVWQYRGPVGRTWVFNEGVVRDRYVTDWSTPPYGNLRFGHLAPDIGYIWIPTFDGSSFGPDMDLALARLSDVRALVVDVRDNGGGSNRNALDVASRFVTGEHVYAYMRFRSGPAHGDFTAPHAELVHWAGALYTGRAIVLANRGTYSAAEMFVLMMRTVPGVTVVGDSTGGAGGNPLTRELPNGWTYRFSQTVISAPDGTTFEGTGLAPDLWVPGSYAALTEGVDLALDSALAVARRTSP